MKSRPLKSYEVFPLLTLYLGKFSKMRIRRAGKTDFNILYKIVILKFSLVSTNSNELLLTDIRHSVQEITCGYAVLVTI